MGRTKRKVKRSAPLHSIAVLILKMAHHLAFCVLVISLIGTALLCSTYGEENKLRYPLYIASDKETSKEIFVTNKLYGKALHLLRYATIRSQLEVEGNFDGNKIINISEYTHRKETGFVSPKRAYFYDANFRLEDLLKWQQSGAVQYLENILLMSNEEIAKNGDEKFRFPYANIEGTRLEYIVLTVEEYKELLRQLIDCMNDLAINYNEYLTLKEEFTKPDTNFVYYVEMGNENGDVYTNVLASKPYETYFEGIDYFAKVNTYLTAGLPEEVDITFDDLVDPNNAYTYAFGDNAKVYLGYDLSRGAKDSVATVLAAYDMLNLDKVYTLLGISGLAALFYLVMFCYMMYATGRKLDAHGEEYVELNWIDAIPLELYLAWCGCVGFGLVALVLFGVDILNAYPKDTMGNGFVYAMSIGIALISMIVTETFYSLSRRGKAHMLLKNSLLYKFVFRWIGRLLKYCAKKCKAFNRKIQYYIEHSGHFEKTWGVLLMEVVFSMVIVIVIWCFAVRGNGEPAMIVAILYMLVLVWISYRRMIRKEERMDIVEKIEGIVAGEECRVDAEHLSTENLPLGNAVNEIGEGIRNAVQISTRDERLKAELLTNVSHDIKTPLTSIINYVDLLKKEDFDNEKAKEYLDVLEKKSYKLKNLIQDLIEVSKISTGNIEYEMVPLNVNELMLQATGEYEERFREKCLKLVYDNAVPEKLILADSRRIWRVLENLFSNVYKYALEGTRVYIEVEGDDDKLHISIKNISAKELSVKAEDLTERFVRGDASRTTEGSGLGLAIAKNLVVGQGGTFHIASDGDLFKVKLSFKLYQSS